jgi:hypothetical protein
MHTLVRELDVLCCVGNLPTNRNAGLPFGSLKKTRNVMKTTTLTTSTAQRTRRMT